MTIDLNININFPSEFSRYFEELQKNIGILIQGQKRMADVLDQIIAGQATESTEIEQVKAELDQQALDIAALKSGAIPATDPRFQTILDNQTRFNTALKGMLTAPPAATPVSTDPAPPAGPAPTV